MKATKLIIAASMFSGVVVFNSFGAFAQTVDFVEPRDVLKAVMPDITTYKVKDVTYVMYDYYNKSTFNRDIQLDAYDANMKFAGTSLINKSDDPEEPSQFEGVYAMSDKLVLLKSSQDKKTGNYISIFPVNANAVKQEGTKLCGFPSEK
ncbi:MAG TPA: hypothetical protein VFJ43_14605, partial [Bacteroidia bacterium]|nr:hypothetical protein [Bacteroidia bacterium]